jgi:hypothetical protein
VQKCHRGKQKYGKRANLQFFLSYPRYQITSARNIPLYLSKHNTKTIFSSYSTIGNPSGTSDRHLSSAAKNTWNCALNDYRCQLPSFNGPAYRLRTKIPLLYFLFFQQYRTRSLHDRHSKHRYFFGLINEISVMRRYEEKKLLQLVIK